MADAVLFHRQMAALHRAYLMQLPARIEQIKDLWIALCQGVQVEHTLAALYQQVHQLNGSAPTFGLAQMAGTVGHLEAILKRYLDDALPPSEAERQAVNRDLFLLNQLVAEAGRQGPAVAEEALPAAPVVPARLLLAEDEPLLRRKLALSLRVAGYEVDEAENGLMALIQAERSVPDLVLVDYVMPEFDGVETMRRLRSHMRLKHVPALLLSTPSQLPAARRALGGAIDGFLAKPVDAPDVIAQVEAILGTQGDGAGPLPDGPAPHRQRILIIDDCAHFRSAVALILQQAGFVVEEATNGLEGIEQARKRRPHLILMDASMPVMDGFEATAHLRNDDALATVPILMLTTNVRMRDLPRALHLGVDAYIAKPNAVEQVVGKVRACLGEG